MTDAPRVHPGRRTLVRGAAWSAPVIAASSVVPAYATATCDDPSGSAYFGLPSTTSPNGSNGQFTVPNGVYQLTVTIAGAPGGSRFADNSGAGQAGINRGGGSGAVITAVVPVNPGDDLRIRLGQGGGSSWVRFAFDSVDDWDEANQPAGNALPRATGGGSNYGAGGDAGTVDTTANNWLLGGGGGGASALFLQGSQGSPLLVAGGGGGASASGSFANGENHATVATQSSPAGAGGAIPPGTYPSGAGAAGGTPPAYYATRGSNWTELEGGVGGPGSTSGSGGTGGQPDSSLSATRGVINAGSSAGGGGNRDGGTGAGAAINVSFAGTQLRSATSGGGGGGGVKGGGGAAAGAMNWTPNDSYSVYGAAGGGGGSYVGPGVQVLDSTELLAITRAQFNVGNPNRVGGYVSISWSC